MQSNPISYRRRELDGGIAVNVIRTGTFKAATLVLDFLLPLSAETAAEYALVPYVLDRGCVPFPGQDLICRRLEELYASSVSYRVFRRGGWQVVEIVLDVLDNRYVFDGTDVFAGTMEVLRAVLREPLLPGGVFTPAYVECEKKNLKDAIRARINHKTRYAIHRCLSVMCEGEPCAVSANGTEETVNAVTPESLTAAYRRLLQTARVEVFYVGGLPEETVISAVSGLFSGVARACAPAFLTEPLRRAAQDVRRVTETVDAAQGKLVMGYRLGTFGWEDGYRAVPMMMELLHGSPVSKLFMNVREKQSLCYDCSAAADNLSGVLLIHAGIENENREKTETAISEQLRQLRQGEITAEEWEFAARSLGNAYRSLADSPISLCGWFLGRVLVRKICLPQEMAEQVLSVSREEVAAVAAGITEDTRYFLRGEGSGEDEEEEDG